MRRKKYINLAVLLAVAGLFVNGNSLAMSIEQQRTAFKFAEKINAKTPERQFTIAVAGLEDYVLLPYLKYQRLRKNLHQTSKVLGFLHEYEDSRYAGLLHGKWLRYLGKHKHWKTFLKHYRNTTNTRLLCLYHWAQYQHGKKTAALKGAKKLWLVGVSQPKECNLIFQKLENSSVLKKKMIWMRFRLALENRKIRLAEYVKKMLNNKEQKIADFWLKVHKKSALIQQPKYWKQHNAQTGLIFAHGVDRMSRKDLLQAIKTWDQHKAKFNINQHRVNQLERKLALSLAFNKNSLAYRRLTQLKNTDKTVREWQIRAALNDQNWQQVNEALNNLSAEEKVKEKWRYWQSRAYSQIGKQQKSKLILKQLATARSYYGFMAANSLQLALQLEDHPILVEQQQLELLKQLKPFAVVSEFRAIGRIEEAKRNWWYAVRSVDKVHKIIAAKLAEQWGWNQIAIFTIARVKHWDDVKLRFPVAFSNQVQKNARRQQLDPAIVYGLIRRESAFDKNAISPVGARGLMQIMPRTGKQIARDLKERWWSKTILFNPDVNVKYGTYYYKKLLDKFKGHYALAAAAYNAGPNRIKKWLPEQSSIPADIWIETIPFSETRDYVAAVLSYALIYQQRMGWNNLKFRDFMRDVTPRAD